MIGIYLSYRRKDAAAYAGRLFDHLGQHFGPGSVFRDIDTIRRGEDFAQVIESALNASDVVLVVIGNTWATGQDGLRRLDDPEDWVRLEVAAALRRNVLVVPVLVDGARIPEPATLPEELRALCRRHACELSDLRWAFDVGELVKDLEKVVRSTKRFKVPGVKDRRLRWLAGSVVVLSLSIGMVFFGFRKTAPVQSGTVKPWQTRKTTSQFDIVTGDGPAGLSEVTPVTGSTVAPVESPIAGKKQSEDKESAIAPAPDVRAKDKRVNLLAKENGQVVVATSGAWADIIDGGEDDYAGFSLGAFAIFEFKNARPATFDLFTTLIKGTSGENVKEFELWQGNESPTGSFQLIGTFQTQNVKLFKTPDQEFRFLPVTAKYLKLKINSAWDPSYGVHLRRVQLFGTLQ